MALVEGIDDLKTGIMQEIEEKLDGHNTSPYEEALLFHKSSPDRILLTVKDMAMSPLYKIHDILGGKKLPMEEWPDFFGKPCIIKLSHDHVICRLLYPSSSAPHKYHLVSTNAHEKNSVLSDQSVENVFKIIFMRKPD